MLLIKESCNLNGQKHILVNHLKVQVIHEKDIFYLRIQLIFRSELLLMWQYYPRPTKFTSGKSRHV